MSKKESPIKTIVVAVVLSLVCSVVVSFAAIQLKPQQELNKELDRKRNILIAARLLEQGGTQAEIDELFKQVETKVVDLSTGEFIEPPKSFNQRKFAKDPKTNKVLQGKEDIAGIKRRSQFANVYLVHNGQELDTIVLPVHGYGLWSTMYGFLALEPDTKTVVGFKYYEQGETAGLGGEIENPTWLSQWPEKEVLNEQGKPVIKLVKGSAQNENQVDGLSGATLTSNGVENTLHYWLGEDGFGPFLERVRAGEI